jgi:hypothetical protein
VRKAIAALGGPSHVGRKLYITQGSVSGWIMEGRVARGWHLQVYLSLKEQGIDPHPSLFGLKSWDDVMISPPNGSGKTHT